MKAICLSALLVGVSLICGCSQQSCSPPATHVASDEVVLAKVGSHEITLIEFEAELKRRARGNPGAFATDEQRQKLLDEMIEFEVLLARAREAGYERDPDIKARMNQFVVSRFQDDQLARLRGSDSKPTDAELLEFYDQHREQFVHPAAIRLGVIEFKTSSKTTGEKRAELKQKASAVLAEARAADAAGFARIALQHSEDQATRYAGGDTGWIRQDSDVTRWDESVVSAASEISESGNCAPLVETPNGFYIVRLLDRRVGSVRPFTEVKEAIAYQITQQREFERQEQVRLELRRGMTIETNPDFLKLLAAPDQSARNIPPAMPGS